MALKDEWKETGKGLGQAFAGLGKSIGRTAKTGVDAAAGEEMPKDENGNTSTVFNDGTWREAGKGLGHAFAGLGKSLVHSAQAGLDALDKDEKKKDGNE